MEDKRTLCEALISGKWYKIRVEVLVEYKNIQRRCPECKAEIKLMRKGRDGQKAHFEHSTRNSDCSESIAFGKHSEYGKNIHTYIVPGQKEIDDSFKHKSLLDFVLPLEIKNSFSEENEELYKRARELAGSDVAPTGEAKPDQVSRTINIYKRDAAVVSFVLSRAKGVCELCEVKAPFTTKSGDPYLEVHHVIHLADGGADTVSNAVAVCPNCHKELHYGARSFDLAKSIYSKSISDS